MAAVKLGSKSQGSIVKLKEDGKLVEFYVAKHNYESGLNGKGRTLLVRKECYDIRQWHSTDNNAYASSGINGWLNGTYKNLLDPSICAAMGTTKIYYTIGYGNNTKSTLERGVFLLSATELGQSGDRVPVEGSVLPIANILKIAYLNGTATIQWTRSPRYESSHAVWYLDASGNLNPSAVLADRCDNYYASRPSFTLPASLYISDDGTVTTNTAPGTPSGISVPNNINGGSAITVSWGASTDSEGNLEGYIVERSVDGGSVWTQIYQGSGRSTANTVAFGTSSVMYRVKAFDSEGLQSGWRTSQQITVLNNNAPSAPASIAVPETVNAGQAFAVAWGAASDSDGDLAGYSLERQLNGGSWAEVYNGAALTYTDTLEKGWNTVAYRVRAYDAHTAYSGYTTSPTRAVNNNTAPVISGQDAALGLKNGSFSQSYTVTDAESDAVTVTEFVDNVQLRAYPVTLGQEQAVTVPREVWLTLANGNHQLRVEASDGNAAAVRVWTFSKRETVICFRLAAPEETDTAATKVLVSPTWNVAGATAKIEACNNAFDEAPAWEDITAMVLLNRVYNFQNKAKTAGKWGVDFRFTITKNEGYEGEVSITGFGGTYE